MSGIKRRLPTILKSIQNTVRYTVPTGLGIPDPSAIGSAKKMTINVAAVDFGVRLFQNSIQRQGKGNVLISPLSVLSALVLVANGARGSTLAQMESVFGASVTKLNKYLNRYKIGQECPKEISIANAVWLRNNLEIALEPDFLQTSKKYLDASVHLAPFNAATLKRINGWVKKCTNGKITEILNELNPSAMMYLLNAVAFFAEWEESLLITEVRKEKFTKEDGIIQYVEMMCKDEDYYLEDKYAKGFLKFYKGRQYAFVALLPKKGITVAQYAASLTGQHLYTMLANPIKNLVSMELPKFKVEYCIEISDILQKMGIIDAFGKQADFSGIGRLKRGKLSLDRVLHRTYISVDENGTNASAMLYSPLAAETKYVHLNRPFLYMIVDCKMNFPVFMGTVMEVL